MARCFCIYPWDDFIFCDSLPEPPSGAEWIFEGSSNNCERYTLKLSPVKVTFQNELGCWEYMSDSLPQKDGLPPIPAKEGFVGRWAIPDYILEPVTIFPVYYPESTKNPEPAPVMDQVQDRPIGCPECHSPLIRTAAPGGYSYISKCSKCPFTGPISLWKADQKFRKLEDRYAPRPMNSKTKNQSVYHKKKPKASSVGKCPRCNAGLWLCQNSTTLGWFSQCSKCSYQGPPETYFGESTVSRRYHRY